MIAILMWVMCLPQVSSTFLQPVEIEPGITCFELELNWDDWLNDSDRLTWWMSHGWIWVKEMKESAPLLDLDLNGSPESIDPLLNEFSPDLKMPINRSLSGGGGVQFHSLERCETLYQRYVTNRSAQLKESIQ